MKCSREPVMAAALLAMGLAGCATSSDSGPTRLDAGAVEWREPAAYEATIQVDCGERDAAYGQWRVTVNNGAIVEATALDERAELTASIESAPRPPTVGEVLAAAAAADADGAESVVIERGPDGIPLRVEVDYQLEAVDDEACWTISDLVETAGA